MAIGADLNGSARPAGRARIETSDASLARDVNGAGQRPARGPGED